MKTFCSVDAIAPASREAEHGGIGFISFRRLLDEGQFESPLDFVDYTVIPPESTIGRHFHHENEEVYFVVAGEPLITVSGRQHRARPGTISVVRSGEWHELQNDTEAEVTILVFQVSMRSTRC